MTKQVEDHRYEKHKANTLHLALVYFTGLKGEHWYFRPVINLLGVIRLIFSSEIMHSEMAPFVACLTPISQ